MEVCGCISSLVKQSCEAEVYGTQLLMVDTCLLAGLLNYSSTMKMEAIRSSETSGTTQRTTRHHIPEEDTLRI
jgi:hypothetical protein